MAAGDGLVSMTPSSIAHSGTSASINADGGVDFSAVTSLSLNGVFTSDYDNYLIVVGPLDGSTNVNANFRLRLSGSDASGTDYTFQELVANSTTVSGGRSTSQTYATLIRTHSNTRSGFQCHVYGPALAQPTALRSTGARDLSSAATDDRAVTHSLSTAYDGFSLVTLVADTITGTVHVFGYEE